MSIIIVAAIGLILGFTSHITNKGWAKKALGALEGMTVVSAFNWLFYITSMWWWLAMILGIVCYALYLMILQALLRTRVVVDQSGDIEQKTV